MKLAKCLDAANLPKAEVDSLKEEAKAIRTVSPDLSYQGAIVSAIEARRDGLVAQRAEVVAFTIKQKPNDFSIPTPKAAPAAAAQEPKPRRKVKKPHPRKGKFTTMGGAIDSIGKISKKGHEQEVKDLDLPWGVAAKIFRKDGMPWDLAMGELRDLGFLGKDESFTEYLRSNPEPLKRGKIGDEAKTDFQKDQEAEAGYEFDPEAPPAGRTKPMLASKLEKGKAYTIMNLDTKYGWNVYDVTEVDPFEVTLMSVDGTETVAINDKLDVLIEGTETQEIIDDKDGYVDWSKIDVKEKDGITAEYFATYKSDDSFKAWKSRAEIERMQNNIGENLLVLGQEDYGHQPRGKGPAVGKSKQMGFNFDDPNQNTLFEPTYQYLSKDENWEAVREGPPSEDELRQLAFPTQAASQTVFMESTGTLRATSKKIKGAEQAAALVGRFANAAQESFWTIAVDDNQNILEIHRANKGTKGAVTVSPAEMAGRIFNTPGTKKVYTVHNHPGGSTLASQGDIAIHGRLNDTLALRDIEMTPIVVTRGKWATYFNQAQQGVVPDKPGRLKMQIMERFLNVGDTPNQPIVNNSVKVQDWVKANAPGQEGFLMLNAQMRPLGWMTYPKGLETREAAAQILATMERHNAIGVVGVFNDDLTATPGRSIFIRNMIDAYGGEVEFFDLVQRGRSVRDAGGNLKPGSRADGARAALNDNQVLLKVTSLDKLDKPQKAAINRRLKSLPKAESLRIRKNLKRLRGTPWETMATTTLLVEQAVEERLQGKVPNFKSDLDGRAGAGYLKSIKTWGEEGIWRHLELNSNGLGHADKPVNSVNGAYRNCDPTKFCATACYASKGRYIFPNNTVGGVMQNWAAEKDPVRYARMVADRYKRTPEGEVGQALRMFDKGDGSDAYNKVIDELNRQGVRTSTFSRLPDFIRKIDPSNVRMLSVDRDNRAVAEANPDLSIAMLYEGGKDNDFLNAQRERYDSQGGVVLPVRVKVQKLLSKEEVDKIPAWAKKFTCPIDAGTKTLRTKANPEGWACTDCDKQGGIGCYYHKSSAMLESLDRIERKRGGLPDGRLQDLRRRLEEAISEDPAGAAVLLEELDTVLGKVRRSAVTKAAKARPKKHRKRVDGDDTKLTVGEKPKTFDPNRALNATETRNLTQTFDLVDQAMRDAGMTEAEIRRVMVELKPIIDLRGKDADVSIEQWASAGKSADMILGATTMRKVSALMELSLEQDLNSLEKSAYHESFHIMARWILGDTRYNQAVGFYGGNEELTADAFADHVFGKVREGRRPTGMVRRMFNQLKALLQKLGNALRGKGFNRPQDIFEGLRTRAYPTTPMKDWRTTTAMQAEQRAQKWYSQMVSHLDAKLPGKGTPQQLTKMLDAWAAKGLIKSEELSWSGLREFLDEKSKRTTNEKGVANSVLRAANSLSDLRKTDAFLSHGYSGVDVPTKVAVLEQVFRAAQDPEIRKSIIRLVPVDVMNILVGEKFSPQRLFNDKAMFLDLFSTPADSNVSGAFVDMALAVIDTAASQGTEALSGIFDLSGVFKNGLPTVSANNRNHKGSFLKEGINYGPKGQTKKVAKQEIMDYLAENHVALNEVEKSGGRDAQYNPWDDALGDVVEDGNGSYIVNMVESVEAPRWIDYLDDDPDELRNDYPQANFEDSEIEALRKWQEDNEAYRDFQIGPEYTGQPVKQLATPSSRLYYADTPVGRYEIRQEGDMANVYLDDRLLESYDKSDTDVAIDHVQDDFDERFEPPEEGGTLFDQWQMKGESKDYRELLLTLPAPAQNRRTELLKELDKKYGGEYGTAYQYSDLTEDEKAEITKVSRQADQDILDKKTFTAGHFDEPNVVAHVRFNERMLPGDVVGMEVRKTEGARPWKVFVEGHDRHASSWPTRQEAKNAIEGAIARAPRKRVLFIEEIQSDLHQKGRREGYNTGDKTTKIWDLFDKGAQIVWEISPGARRAKNYVTDSLARRNYLYEGLSEEKAAEYEARFKPIQKKISEYQKSQASPIPDAPFKKTWPMLAMKRMVRYAAENGYDSIAWTPGEVQADRYNLAKVVDAIEWDTTTSTQSTYIIFKGLKGISDQDIEVVANKDGIIEVMDIGAPEEWRGKHLSDVVGKDIAAKILKEDQGELREDGLKVGGGGMKGFYDKMLPRMVGNFFGKKAWGNAKVGTVTMSARDRGAAVSVGELRAAGLTENPFTKVVDIKDGKRVFSVLDRTTNERHYFDEGPDADRWMDQRADELFGQKEVWHMPITPKMREKALTEGMTMFRVADTADAYDDHMEPAQAEAVKAARHSKTPLRDRFTTFLKNAYETFIPGNAFPLLKAKVFGKANEVLRNANEISAYSRWKAADDLREILQPGELQGYNYDVFNLKIVLDDMLRDTEEGGVLEDYMEKHGELPFKFESTDQLKTALTKLDTTIAANPVIQQALDRRDQYMRDLRRRLVKAKLLPQKVLEDPRYFHHQVLEYADMKRQIGTGHRDFRVKKKGYQIHRLGSIKDYNTDYLTAEYEILAQGIAQLEMGRNLDEIDNAYNIIGQLRRQAKHDNYVAIVGGQDNYTRLIQLRGQKAEILGSSEDGNGKGLDSGEKQMLKQLNEQIWELDPTMPFRAKIAMGFSNLAKTGAPPGSRYDMEVDTDDMTFKDIVEMMEAGSMGAATVVKGVTERRQFIEQTLGRHFETEKTLMDKRKPLEGSEGWVEWVPRPGSAWYMTNSLNDKLIEQLIAGTRELKESDVQHVFARGRDAKWIIPAELAATLDGGDFMTRPSENVVQWASEWSLNLWKRWILINPMRILKYNINNTSGDLDITLAYNPKIVKHAKQAATDLWRMMHNKGMAAGLKAELDKGLRDGVIGSGMTVHDIPDIANHADFEKLMTAMNSNSKQALTYIKKFWQSSKDYTTWRENILRLAAYRHFKAEIAAGKKVYGVSDQAKVDMTTDANRKAALLARELIGDYGNLSKGGQWLRRKMIPFYSWMEINTPRYYRLYKNLAIEGEAGGRRLRMGGVMVKKGTMLTARAAILFAAVNAFNHLFWPDEEEELGAAGRRQMHLILGRNRDGTIQTLRIQGALSDALGWLGMEDLPEDVRDLASGRKTIDDQVSEALLAPAQRLVNAVRPDVKTPAEALTGKTLYPDITKPRPIRDKLEHTLRMFSLDAAWRRVAGRPSKEKDALDKVLGDLGRTFTYSSDPGEMSYYDTRSIVYDFLEKQGIERGTTDPTSRANALYYYRQALKYGDGEAALKYHKKYLELGGKAGGLIASVKRAHPLAPIPKNKRGLFFRSLTVKDRQTLNRATQWYRDTYYGRQGQGY